MKGFIGYADNLFRTALWKLKTRFQDLPPEDFDQPSVSFLTQSTFREKARRQVRYMFIYPLSYVALWVLPFVSQQLQHQNKAHGPPFPILLLGQVSICLQGALDSIIFLSWEKPWRYSRFRSSHGATRTRRFSIIFIGGRPGRTREEMQVDMANARERRQMESADRRTWAPASREGRPGPHWWDPYEAGLESVEGGSAEN
jgi:hypothetical protein